MGPLVCALWSGALLLYLWEASVTMRAVLVASTCICLGIAWNDLRARVGELTFCAEWAHAQAHWEELRIGAQSASADGQDLEAYVRSRGYRAEGVVKAIVHDLVTDRTV